MLDTIIIKYAVGIILTAIPVGIITSVAFQWAKKQEKAIDAMPPWMKNGAIALVATIMASVAAFTGVDIQCVEGENCLAQLDDAKVRAIIEAALAILSAKLTHGVIKGRKAKGRK